MKNKRKWLTPKEAEALLPDGDSVHTFRQATGMGLVLIGADWTRKDILDAIQKNQCELAGKTATEMGHGLVIHTGGYLFVQTKKLEAAQ